MDITDVIRHGVITEKSVDLQRTSRDTGRNRGPKTGEIVPRYTFKVALEANKIQIKQAVEAMFPGKKVVRVNTMRMPGKSRTLRTRKGIYRSEARPWKKAIVTLADGQFIDELQA
jgi:large subunit ribosomal protein L23